MPQKNEHQRSRFELASLLYHVLAFLAGLLLRLVFGLRIKKEPRIRELEGPVLVIGNHPSFLDPMIMASALQPRRIRFLTSRSFFKNPLIGAFLYLLGAIPITQFGSDIKAIKSILRWLKRGGTIALYPEGQRSIDGCLQPVDEAIAKLIKKADCPVVLVMEHGAYLTWPRWARAVFRIGRIQVSTRLLFTKEELHGLTTDVIFKRMMEAMAYNDYEWQRQNKKPFYYKTLMPAKGMDRVCHQCPACEKELAMKSASHTITCRFCGNQGRVLQTGFIHQDKDQMQTMNNESKSYKSQKVWSDVAKWHHWQLDYLKQQMIQPFFKRSFPATLSFSCGSGKKKKIKGILTLTAQDLYFYEKDNPNDPVLLIPIANRTGTRVSLGRYIDFVSGKFVYRFRTEPGRAVIILSDIIQAKNETACLQSFFKY